MDATGRHVNDTGGGRGGRYRKVSDGKESSDRLKVLFLLKKIYVVCAMTCMIHTAMYMLLVTSTPQLTT